MGTIEEMNGSRTQRSRSCKFINSPLICVCLFQHGPWPLRREICARIHEALRLLQWSKTLTSRQTKKAREQPGGASSDLRSAPHRLFASDRRGPTTAPCARTKHCVPGAQVKRRRLSAVVSCLRTFVSGLLRVVACTSQRVLLALSRSAHTRLRIVWLRSRACCVSWCSLLELQTSISA